MLPSSGLSTLKSHLLWITDCSSEKEMKHENVVTDIYGCSICYLYTIFHRRNELAYMYIIYPEKDSNHVLFHIVFCLVYLVL